MEFRDYVVTTPENLATAEIIFLINVLDAELREREPNLDLYEDTMDWVDAYFGNE